MSAVKVVEGGTLIDGTGRKPFEDAIIIVKNSKIVAVGRRGEVDVPQGEVIDARGNTILPGLIECHAHVTLNSAADVRSAMSQPLTITVLEAERTLQVYLEAGYTTVRDCGGVEGIDIGLKKAIERGIIEGPRLLVSGKTISITSGHGDFYFSEYDNIPVPHTLGIIADGADGVRKAAREQLRAGVDWIKLMASGGLLSPGEIGSPQLTLGEIQAACEEAHKAGKRVSAHAISALSIKNAIKGGVDTIEHGSFADDEALEMMKGRNVSLVFGSMKGVKLIQTRGLEAGIPKYVVEKTRESISYREMGKICLEAMKAGVNVVPGSDAGCPLNEHGANSEELELWVEAGFTPLEAITATTSMAARALGLENQIGTIEPKKFADIIILDGAPQENIRILQDKPRIRVVMKGGQIVRGKRT